MYLFVEACKLMPDLTWEHICQEESPVPPRIKDVITVSKTVQATVVFGLNITGWFYKK